MRTLLIIILVTITRIETKVCNEDNHTVALNNKVFNGLKYGEGEFYVDDSTGVDRGCVCLKEKCARKCCPFGQASIGAKCVNTTEVFSPQLWRESSLVKGANATKELHFIIGQMNCSTELNEFRVPALPAADLIGLRTDGRLFVEVSNNVPPLVFYNTDNYCIDTFYESPEDTNPKINALICWKVSDTPNHYALSSSCMLISCFFILLTVAVYAWLPELQNLNGLVLIAHLLCFFVGFVTLATMQIMILHETVPAIMCLIATFIIYFSLLSAFFWLNVMCFDIWWTFSGKRGSHNRSSPRKRFLTYSLYAFGIPTALTILLAILEFSNIPKPNPLLPNIQTQGCFLYGKSKLIYLYTPIMVLCLANLIFFTLTAIKIAEIRKSTSNALKSKDSTYNQQKKDRQRFTLYVKLFAIMGINWVLEVISSLYPEGDYIWQFSDAYNVLVGLIIFIIFVCKKKIFKKIKDRIKHFQSCPTSSEEMKNMSNDISHGPNDGKRNPNATSIPKRKRTTTVCLPNTRHDYI